MRSRRFCAILRANVESYSRVPKNHRLTMSEKDLKLLAVSPPHWAATGTTGRSRSLDSLVPFSLQNAIRFAGTKALEGNGPLGCSNWSTIGDLRDSVLLYKFFNEDLDHFKQKLSEIRPNILLMSVMTLSMPGAIEFAKAAKEIVGDELIIIIGGKHINETTFLTGSYLNKNSPSPILFPLDGITEHFFDFAIAGEAEAILAGLLGTIGEQLKRGSSIATIKSERLPPISAPGRWLLVQACSQQIAIQTGDSTLDIDCKYPFELFVHDSVFDVLGGTSTAHLYSYMGNGCPMDCFFCSERRMVNGKPNFTSKAADRLAEQLRQLPFEYPFSSAFVEDSILLGGDTRLWDRLFQLLKDTEKITPFGCQLTIDLILHSKSLNFLRDLAGVGLRYVFFGMETLDPAIAAQMSKNVAKKYSWFDRTAAVIELLSSLNLDVGVSLLFGLGENQEQRLQHLSELRRWQVEFGQPKVVSMNFATKHPLMKGEPLPTYLEWGTAVDSPRLQYYTRLFGEASELYCMDQVIPASESDLKYIEMAFQELLPLSQ